MTAVLLSAFPAHGRAETDIVHQATKDMIEQFKLATKQFFFPSASYAPAAGVREQVVTVQLGDANDVRMLFGDNRAKRVTVQRNSGTAPGPSLVGPNGVTGTSIVVNFDRGQVTFTAKATGTGTIVIGLTDSDSTGLTATDTVTVTFS